MSRKKRVSGESSLMLAQYEDDNRDLPRALRRQLAIFVLAPKVGVPELETLFQRPLGCTPVRHRAWLWWTAMSTSGLGDYWDEFVGRRNSGVPMKDCLIRMRRLTTQERWHTLSRRIGSITFSHNIINVHAWPNSGNTLTYWTRGGTWYRNSRFTQIIVLGESFERDHNFNTVTQALSPNECRLLERELHNTIDQERLLYPDAIRAAIAHVRHRVPQVLGWKKDVTGYRTISWFFQTAVPVGNRGWIDFRSAYEKPQRQNRRGKPHLIDWLPPVEVS